MHNILLVGGVFDLMGGRPSGYVAKLGIALGAKIINGGSYDYLTKSLECLNDITHLFWFADVPNDLPKLLPKLANRNPGMVLIQSKNNRMNKYSRLDLFDRMRNSRSELLIEFTNGQNGVLEASLLAVHGKVLLDKTENILVLAQHLMDYFTKLDSLLLPININTSIPYGDHPGAFGTIRKHHMHEGVDLYADHGTNVYAMEDGVIVSVNHFTGKQTGSDWWNDTICIMVEGDSGVLNYGELGGTISEATKIIGSDLFVGAAIKRGDLLGRVSTVLKKNKGLPMAMLHLERYVSGTIEPVKEWTLGEPQPSILCDPTVLLFKAKVHP